VKLLLDTHAFILFLSDPDRLPERARTALEDPDNELVPSIVSPWEMQIKAGMGKLKLAKSPRPPARASPPASTPSMGH
jgi:PIN domain nuclease of toxin-antitoxin system